MNVLMIALMIAAAPDPVVMRPQCELRGTLPQHVLAVPGDLVVRREVLYGIMPCEEARRRIRLHDERQKDAALQAFRRGRRIPRDRMWMVERRELRR